MELFHPEKIAVIMSDNRDLEIDLEKAAYNSLSTCINYNYCKLHGYDFFYYQPYYKEINPNTFNCVDPKTKEPRHPSWSKLLSVSKLLNSDYKYIVYIDTDAVFRTLDYKIETFILKYLKDNDFIFLDNSSNLDVIGPEGDACAGFFVIKNNGATKKIIDDWYNLDLPQFNTTPFFEQHGLWWRIIKQMKASIVPEPHFHEKSGQLIRHMHSGLQGDRVLYFINLLNERKLNLNTNTNVNWVQFDTSIA